VLDRALELLGEAWRRRDAQESEAEAALERLRRAEADLADERASVAKEAERLSREREDVARAKAKLREEGLAGFEKARRELARRVDEELAAMRADASRRAQASSAQLLADAEDSISNEPVLVEARLQEEERSRALEVGGRARVRGGRVEGVVAALDGESAWLEMAGKRMKVPRAELEPLGRPEPGDTKPKAAARKPRKEAEPEGRSGPSSEPVREVNVIGRRLDEAIDEVEKAIDEALVAGLRLRVIHGHGTGRLRDGLREHLRSHRSVASARAADAREGGNGATMVELK
jgi:DNA mismatch repair protein MutS2